MKKRGTLLLCALVLIVAFLLPVGAYAQELKTGWVQNSSGDWNYYLEDGTLAKLGVFYIDGAYYGFNWYGQMYKNTTFSVYDSEDGYTRYYRAKEDGKLYVNEWYMDDYGSYYYMYYYGEAGRAPYGLTTVDDITYFFYIEGEMARNDSVVVDGVVYMADDNGYLTQLVPGWNYYDEHYYYVKDGKLASEEVLLINGAYYGFAWDGHMYEDTDFRAYDEEDNWCSYRAKADGKLYVNEWYMEDYGAYYYGDAGKAPYGLTTVDDIIYFFYSDGLIARNTSLTADGGIYVADDNGYLTELSTGWNYVNENYYYVKDGKLACNKVLLIDGAYYGFDYSGKMYADQRFSIYDWVDKDEWYDFYYRAKADGKLYVNEWYTDDEGDRYYYGEAGRAPRGLVTVEDVLYYVGSWGRVTRNQVVSQDGISYYADDNGALTQLVPGWNQLGEKRYYVKENGEFASREFLYIDGGYYYFGSSGYLYADTLFSMSAYDENGDYIGRYYYRAKEDGTLYVNEWYENDWGTYYYYGEGGRAATGLMIVEDVLHYFDYDGELLCNRVVTEDGVYYYADEDGVVTQLVPGWNQLGEYRYYVKENGEFASGEVLCIDGAYYGFNWNGPLYVEEEFTLDEYGEDGYWHTYSYRAREDGTLYVNEWCLTPWLDTYYYGEGGRGAQGVVEIDGILYGFAEDGLQLKEALLEDDDGTYYYVDANGHASVMSASAGWLKVGDDYYYVGEDGMYKNTIANIGGVYYGFDGYGRMYDNEGFSMDIYDENGAWLSWEYFRAQKGGALYVNQWYQDKWGDWYYYGEGGIAPRGLAEVNGVKYYFYYDGQMATNQLMRVDGEYCYVLGESGIAYDVTGSIGWVYVEGSYYYFDADGEPCRGLQSIDGQLYYFYGNYRMADDECFYDDIYNEEDGSWEWVVFRARKGGALYVSQWYQDDNGRWYYYGETGAAAEGLVTVGGVTYYFDYDGEMMTDQLVYEEAGVYAVDGNGYAHKLQTGWSYIDGHYYYMDEEGYAPQNEIVELDGKLYYFNYFGQMLADGKYWVDARFEDVYLYGQIYARPDGSLYRNQLSWDANRGMCFYNEYGILKSDGLAQIDGVYYYLNDGVLIKNETVVDDGHIYVFGAGGIGYKVEGTQWVQGSAGEWYYVIDGVAADGIVEIDGIQYLLSEGYMLTNSWYWVYDEEVNEWVAYLADANGHPVTQEGWHTVNGYYVYVQEDGTLLEGLQSINGVTYYFTPVMEHDTVLRVDGKLYIAGASGALTEYVGDGIYEINGCRYLVVDGQLVCDQWISYNGKLFRARENGMLYSDCIWYCDDDERYAFNVDGTLVTNGWIYLDYATLYADASGKLATGVQSIDGKQYFFNSEGILITNGYYANDGSFWLIGADGSVMEVTDQSGWIYFNGSYYYMDGYLYSDYVVKIDGKRYVFDGNGRMCTDTFVNGVYADASGEVMTGWFTYDGEWYYSNEYGFLVSGLREIDGNTYYLSSGRMLTGIHCCEDDGLMYLVDCGTNGVVISKTLLDSELVYADGYAYYAQNGVGYTGWLGNLYFDEGVLCFNQIIGTGDNAYYLKPDGNCAYGFTAVDVWWIYANENGTLAYNEWKLIGGCWYYFDEYFMVSDGCWEIDGKLCQFDENGCYLGVVAQEEPSFAGAADGWYYWGGEYYYIHAGEPVCDMMLLINGSWYYFDDAGIMVSNQLLCSDSNECYYYYGSSGARVETTGWALIDGEYYYFNQDHSVRFGMFMDNGVLYYIDLLYIEGENGEWYLSCWMAQDTYEVNRGKLYYFDNSGAGTVIDVQNGWYNAYGDWYYFRNGELVNGEQSIGGTTYYFSNYRMITNGFAYSHDYEKRYYVDGNGQVVRTPGWHQLAKGWIYINEDGSVKNNGVYLIDGVVYAFEGVYWVN